MKITDQIDRAAQRLEQEIIPKTRSLLKDSDGYLEKRLIELKRLQAEAKAQPRFPVGFLGATQNGKSTLINALLGRKVLPEGHVGACSAAIVRCRYAASDQISVTFRYVSENSYLDDLREKETDARLALEQDDSPAKIREAVCNLLGRFHKLLGIEPQDYESTEALIDVCVERALDFPESCFLGETKEMLAGSEGSKEIEEGLSARGRLAFILDECTIEGRFPDWHEAMELIDMPGTNAFNPWDDQVNTRLKEKVAGLALVTKETQLHQTEMDWFKETPILNEIAGASERNQVRVFMIKTFVDKLDLEDECESKSQWEQTREYCGQIEEHLRKQLSDLVAQRFATPEELEVLREFVEQMPVSFVSPKTYRNLVDSGLRKKVTTNPMKHLDLAAAFERFDQNPENTGIPDLQRVLRKQTDEFIKNHFLKKLTLDYGKEVGLVARFFREKRVGLEQRLANESEAFLEIEREVQAAIAPIFEQCQTETEETLVDLKNRFNAEADQILDGTTRDLGRKIQRKLEDWLQLHWASLRCAGRKNGHHITARGYEIDFNGVLADLCIEALNGAWISYRQQLRDLLYGGISRRFIPELEKAIAHAKGGHQERSDLIGMTFEEIANSARSEIELEMARYDAAAEQFDSLRPKLTMRIRKHLQATYEGIASEAGRGSAARMRSHLNRGMQASATEFGPMLREVVKGNWDGLTHSLETQIYGFFDSVDKQFKESGARFKAWAEHPSDNDEEILVGVQRLEQCWNCEEVEDGQ